MKTIDFRGRVPFVRGLPVVLVFVLVSPVSLFVASLIYASTGPVITLLHIRRKRAARRGSGEGPSPEA